MNKKRHERLAETVVLSGDGIDPPAHEMQMIKEESCPCGCKEYKLIDIPATAPYCIIQESPMPITVCKECERPRISHARAKS
jgi:hypothetical protein